MIQINIKNDDTGSKSRGNYDVTITSDRGLDVIKRLWTGRVENHLRLDGWKTLVRLLAMKL